MDRVVGIEVEQPPVDAHHADGGVPTTRVDVLDQYGCRSSCRRSAHSSSPANSVLATNMWYLPSLMNCSGDEDAGADEFLLMSAVRRPGLRGCRHRPGKRPREAQAGCEVCSWLFSVGLHERIARGAGRAPTRRGMVRALVLWQQKPHLTVKPTPDPAPSPHSRHLLQDSVPQDGGACHQPPCPRQPVPKPVSRCQAGSRDTHLRTIQP